MSTSTEQITFDAPRLFSAPQSKWEREYQAFQRLLPKLLETDRGLFVAIHNEQVVDKDLDEMALITRTQTKVGNVDIHVGKVGEQLPPPVRSGVVRINSTLHSS
ncbi:hypothetical protein BH10PLA2_BH10PLA2_02240 [soil metagenome]